MKLNLHGVVGVESAQQIEEEEYEETVKVYESASAKVRILQPQHSMCCVESACNVREC